MLTMEACRAESEGHASAHMLELMPVEHRAAYQEINARGAQSWNGLPLHIRTH